VNDAMKVWIDQELCTGDGQCVDICPDVFFMHDDGRTYRAHVRNAEEAGGMASVPRSLEAEVVEAAEDCPGTCIFVEHG
jgi:ferredoxin